MKVVNIFPSDTIPKLGILLGEDESSWKIYFLIVNIIKIKLGLFQKKRRFAI